jgi:hydroxypyruvate isomerase
MGLRTRDDDDEGQGQEQPAADHDGEEADATRGINPAMKYAQGLGVVHGHHGAAEAYKAGREESSPHKLAGLATQRTHPSSR